MKHAVWLALAVAAWVAGCGESKPPATASDQRVGLGPQRLGVASEKGSGGEPTGGSSDGVTCEDAQNQNVEEMEMGKKGPADLTAQDLGAVLNNGSYLGECEVPSDAKVSICAAVKQGAVVGVTVAMSPSNPEVEVCVAKQVRGLQFPVHPKMDIVRTRF